MNKKILIASIAITGLILLSGCLEPPPDGGGELAPIPETAKILFASNRDSGSGRAERHPPK